MKITAQDLMNLIGVEEGQEFSIEGLRYTFDGDRLMVSGVITPDWRPSNLELNELLSCEIILPPWRPKPGEAFYMPFLAGESKYSQYRWINDEADNFLYERGLVCQTAEEAIEKTDKMLEVLK